MTIGWEHPIDSLKGWEGINSADMEWFRDEPLEKLARECVQNALDAGLDNSKPVKVEFDLIDVKVDSIPDLKALKKNINSALETYKNEQMADSKVINLYENANKLLSKDTMSVFQIIDSNTSGMAWDDSKKCDFFTYMRASSHSSKGGDSGGSFGIGKMAPFVVSGIRTIFASSVYRQDNGYHQVTQGKAELSSLNDDEGILRRKVGLWGNKENFDPVHSNELIDSSWIYKSTSNELNEENIGTKISSLGFNKNQNKIWQYEIASSIIKNFFVAIHTNRLEVNVGGLAISSGSLNNYFKMDAFAQKIKANKYVDSLDWEKEFDITRQYVESLDNNPKVKVIKNKLQYLGNCELRIKIEENLPKRICYIRNGMKITEDLGVSGVKSFSGLMEFVAIFQCLNKKGNEILRSMENPSHNAFDPKRPEDAEERALASNAINELAYWIRSNLNEFARKQGEEAKDIQELLEFFSWEEEEEGEKGSEEVNPFGKPVKVKVKRASRKRLPKIPNPKPSRKRPGPDPSPPSPNPIPTPPNPDPGPGPDVKIRIPVAVGNFRFLKKANGKSIKLFFTPEFSGEANFELFRSEADGRGSNPIKMIKHNDTKAQIFVEGERTEINVELHDELDGSLEIALFQFLKGAKS